MRRLFLLSFTLVVLASCEKEVDSPLIEDEPQPTTHNAYFPLEIGNYWVYQHVNRDASNNETLTEIIDSIVVERDTFINGKQYFVIEGTNYPYNGGDWETIELLRDSLGYLVNHQGAVRFSADNFDDILASKTEVIEQDTLYTLTYQMAEVDQEFSVPAGTFEVLNFQGTVYSFRKLPGIDNPRYLNNLYAKGVGKVLQTYFFFNSPMISEKRLIRYHIHEGD